MQLPALRAVRMLPYVEVRQIHSPLPSLPSPLQMAYFSYSNDYDIDTNMPIATGSSMASMAGNSSHPIYDEQVRRICNY